MFPIPLYPFTKALVEIASILEVCLKLSKNLKEQLEFNAVLFSKRS